VKIRSLDGEQGPYQNVFLQEMDVMNTLLAEIVRSLKELLLGTSRFQTHFHKDDSTNDDKNGGTGLEKLWCALFVWPSV
jgi:hypothetical protein